MGAGAYASAALLFGEAGGGSSAARSVDQRRSPAGGGRFGEGKGRRGRTARAHQRVDDG